MKQCIQSGRIVIESYEHFIKQTYRNRCHIYNSNGLLPLIIPVEHTNIATAPIRDIQISFGEQWKKNHWKSIYSSYKNAAFFDFLEDDLHQAVFHNTKFLLEFNTILLQTVLKLSRIELAIGFSTEYESQPDNLPDLRNVFHPKKKHPYSLPVYHQVFADKHGFISDLSCLDALANEGTVNPQN